MNLYLTTSNIDNSEDVQSLSPAPSPRLAPSPIEANFPSGTRSFSGYSSTSSVTSYSTISAVSKATSISSTSSRRRGYVRPQGASFAPSAKNRESVMSLGSIAHLQYYFARTGLLDGRSGQMVKKKENGEYDIPTLSVRSSSETFDSPIDEEGALLFEAAKEDGDEIMLPPTVSTYRNGTQYVPPPPSQQALKRELVDSLENALHAIEASEQTQKSGEPPTQGFFELEGLQILDTTTLAIRAAKQYYTQHPNPGRLNSIKPDQELRKGLYNVLEVLKKAANRSFAGGWKEEERLTILVWVSDVGMMIDKEAKFEEKERRQRKQWQWVDDSNWINDDRGRTLDFLSFLLTELDTPAEETHTALQHKFWHTLIDGKKLIALHNAAVRRSKRQFGYVEKCHDDVNKPYRRAENIRYWLKAAELRFEIKFFQKLDVLSTVNSKPEEAETMKDFEHVVMEWAEGVRKDLTKDWNGEEEKKLHARARSLALASPLGSPCKNLNGKKEVPPPVPAMPRVPISTEDMIESPLSSSPIVR
ncbi:hypothetical protein LTR70_005807 [Exophiala xenobiotica]|uniref:Uncharacterized protein n=1 Tax=Lithohypha guttulata TaxID=1690604 RepID=A0ABR0K0P7_9EURO|nr:hypothetical protein LTR24_008200 [Lithohypha guttulata]KAK5317612.1 hypothetical protein LTR70_005807 [Exophiala xenobiotica]